MPLRRSNAATKTLRGRVLTQCVVAIAILVSLNFFLSFRSIHESANPPSVSESQSQLPVADEWMQEIRWILNLTNKEHTVYSQNGEDGIIDEIFGHIGTTDRYYVEFGTESGKETNTRALREGKTRTGMKWEGLLMDGGFENETINLHKEFIFHHNIVSLFEKYGVPKEFDLLSEDTDLKDFHINEAVMTAGYRPRVIISESCHDFESGLSFTVAKDDLQLQWVGMGSNNPLRRYTGASPTALRIMFNSFGYVLVYCDKGAVNCFWIRNDLLASETVKILNQQPITLFRHSTCYNPNGKPEKIIKFWRMDKFKGKAYSTVVPTGRTSYFVRNMTLEEMDQMKPCVQSQSLKTRIDAWENIKSVVDLSGISFSD